MKEVSEILSDSLKLYEEKSKEYGEGYKKIGDILQSFFPNGIELKTKGDFERMAHFQWLVSKMNRYSENLTKGGHIDSSEDMVVYSAMLRHFTSES